MARTAADILRDVEANAYERADKLQKQRRSRQTLPDLCNLFERAWMRGQRERSTSAPSSRIVGPSRALLKSQIVRPSIGTELDLEDFAYWTALHWDQIGGHHFAKAKTYPANPTFRWLVACFETYIVAYQQKDYLLDSRTRNTTDLLKKVDTHDAWSKRASDVMAAAQDKIKSLESSLATAQRQLDEVRKTGTFTELEEDVAFQAELKAILAGGKRKK